MPVTPEKVASYRIVRPLGRGGMGVVYEAHDVRSGEVVALKTVTSPEEGMLDSIRREIQALARLRHPGIVRIFDDGVQDGMPWYAMELIDAPTLRAYTEASPATMRLDLETGDREALARPSLSSTPLLGTLRERLSILRRLCAALAYLHGEGLVHRDLKPTNILVRNGRNPILLDFGLAARFAGGQSRERLDVDAASSGTAGYVAPEQCLGEMVDARADLYALGCILYELVTGSPPFHSPDPNQVLRRRLQEEPLPPSARVADVPPSLDDLCLRLLARDPRQRLGHADDVARALAELGADDGDEGTRPPAEPYLYRPGFAGRDEILATLSRHVEELEAGRGGMLLLSGESGVGKTRLLVALGRRAGETRLPVLAGECLPPAAGGGDPYRAMQGPLSIVADHCRASGPETARRLLRGRARLLARYVPAMASIPGLEHEPEPVDLPADAARLRLWRATAEILAAFSAERPACLMLDDLQWADDLTLGLLALLARGPMPSIPLLVVGAYRAEEANAPLLALGRRTTVHVAPVPRLCDDAVGVMASDMLALPSTPEPFVRYLALHSEGNPFFVAEYLRTAVAEGVLVRDERGRWRLHGDDCAEAPYASLPVPGSVRDLVTRRLDKLDARARRTAEVAAVLGRELDPLTLARTVGGRKRFVREDVATLIARHVLEEPTPGTLRFVHDKVREAALAGIEEERLPAMHRAAAEALERLPPPPRHAELGHHWESAGEPGRACAHYLPAAQAALAGHALAEAERLFRAYLRLASPSPERVTARNRLASQVVRRRGAVEEALALHRTACDEARELGAHGQITDSLEGMAIACMYLGRPGEARSLYEAAIDASRDAGDAVRQAKVEMNVAALLLNQGRLDEAERIHRRLVPVFRDAALPENARHCIAGLADIEVERGRPAAALELYREALALQGEEPLFECSVLLHMAATQIELGRLEDARVALDRGHELARRVGDRRQEATAIRILARWHEHRGDRVAARDSFLQALQVVREIADKQSEGILLSNLGTVEAAEGRWDEAKGLYEQALAAAMEVGDRRGEGVVLSNLARVARQAGERPRAVELLERAAAILREVGDLQGEAQALAERDALEKESGR